jgi:hypothetical protein
MSVRGTSRHFAAARQSRRFRAEADIGPDFNEYTAQPDDLGFLKKIADTWPAIAHRSPGDVGTIGVSS